MCNFDTEEPMAMVDSGWFYSYPGCMNERRKCDYYLLGFFFRWLERLDSNLPEENAEYFILVEEWCICWLIVFESSLGFSFGVRILTEINTCMTVLVSRESVI